VEAARRAAAGPSKAVFAIGFLTGQEAAWLARATRVLSDQLPNIEIRMSSGFSTTLADDLKRGKIDIAFLRPEPEPDLEFRPLLKEPLVAILPDDHRLARGETLDPHDLVGEVFIGISEIPRVLRGAVNTYLKKSGVEIIPRFEIDNFAMAISLVASERGVALLPISIEDYLPPSIVSRRLKGREPTVDLVLGYHRANSSPVLKMFLSRIDDLNSQPGTWGRRTKSGAHSAAARSAPAPKKRSGSTGSPSTRTS
jgi:LysR family transcriptional regulator, hca operon transcriptional activator